MINFRRGQIANQQRWCCSVSGASGARQATASCLPGAKVRSYSRLIGVVFVGGGDVGVVGEIVLLAGKRGSYLTERVYKVVLHKAIPIQICHVLHYY